MHFINGELDMESNQQLATHFLNKTHAPHDKNDLGYISATSFTCSNFNHRFVDEIARWSNFIQTILLSTTGNFPNCARWHGLNLENGRFFYTLEMEKSATSYLKAWVGSFDLVIFDCLMYMAYISRMWSCTSFFFSADDIGTFYATGYCQRICLLYRIFGKKHGKGNPLCISNFTCIQDTSTGWQLEGIKGDEGIPHTNSHHLAVAKCVLCHGRLKNVGGLSPKHWQWIP